MTITDFDFSDNNVAFVGPCEFLKKNQKIVSGDSNFRIYDSKMIQYILLLFSKTSKNHLINEYIKM